MFRSKPKSRRVIIPIFSDTHGGSKHGLLSPHTTIQAYNPDGSTYNAHPELNHIQTYLWSIYTDHVNKIAALSGGDDMIVIYNGDMTDGIKYISETISPNLMLQFEIAKANFAPILSPKQVKRLYISEGTEAHELPENTGAYIVAEMLRGVYPNIAIKVVQHGWISIDGFTIDFAHHGPPPGRRLWLTGNEARYYLRDLMLREISAGRKPPDIFCRAHYHNPIIEELRMNGYKSTLIVTPSYSFPGAWTRQSLRSTLYEAVNGMMALEIKDGRLLDIHEYINRTDLRTKETI